MQLGIVGLGRMGANMRERLLPVISAALFARFASRQTDSPAMRAVATLRQQFGGHAVQQASSDSSGSEDPR